MYGNVYLGDISEAGVGATTSDFPCFTFRAARRALKCVFNTFLPRCHHDHLQLYMGQLLVRSHITVA